MFKVWYIPQIPSEAFEREYDNLIDAVHALDLLTDFSLFEFDNRVKPDYCDAAGIQFWYEGAGEFWDVNFFEMEFDDDFRRELGMENWTQEEKDLLERVLR